MSQIEEMSRNKKRPKRLLRSTKVDLTPMVDLGFILITFFVFTSSMMLPKAMELVQPDDTKGGSDLLCESCAITVLAGAGNALYYAEGKAHINNFKKINYTASGLRQVIFKKKLQLKALSDGKKEVMLIIKPGMHSSFKNLIDLVDEAGITEIKRYYITEPDSLETAFLQQAE